MANLIRRENREVARNRSQDDTFAAWEPFRMMDALGAKNVVKRYQSAGARP